MDFLQEYLGYYLLYHTRTLHAVNQDVPLIPLYITSFLLQLNHLTQLFLWYLLYHPCMFHQSQQARNLLPSLLHVFLLLQCSASLRHSLDLHRLFQKMVRCNPSVLHVMHINDLVQSLLSSYLFQQYSLPNRWTSPSQLHPLRVRDEYSWFLSYSWLHGSKQLVKLHHRFHYLLMLYTDWNWDVPYLPTSSFLLISVSPSLAHCKDVLLPYYPWSTSQLSHWSSLRLHNSRASYLWLQRMHS